MHVLVPHAGLNLGFSSRTCGPSCKDESLPAGKLQCLDGYMNIAMEQTEVPHGI